MKPTTKEIYMYLLGGFVVGCSAVVLMLLIFHPLPPDNRDIVNIALGTLLGMAVTVVAYFFGSSKSSADKSEAMQVTAEKLADKVLPTEPVQP